MNRFRIVYFKSVVGVLNFKNNFKLKIKQKWFINWLLIKYILKQ